MQIRGKLFPYPILNKNNAFSNYINKRFDLLFDDESTDERLILRNVRYSTDSKTINDLINTNEIGVALIFECTDVILRKTYDISTSKIDIIKSNQELSGKIELSIFAYAKTEFIYIPDEVDEDYKGIEFQIEKYDIIAANDGVSRRIIHKDSEDNLVKSIFSIQYLSSVENGLFDVQFENSRKILISMSEHDYANYNIVYSMPIFQEVFFNMMLIPALSQALFKCFTEIIQGTDIEDILGSFQWFSSIQKQYLRITGTELTKEIIDTMQPIHLAQKVLGLPMKIALEKLIESTKIKSREEE